MMANRRVAENARKIVLFAIILTLSLQIAQGYKTFHFVNAAQGVVTSPNYPHNYPHHEKCIWYFETLPDSFIKIVFSSFELEREDSCKFDYVEFYDGASQDDLVLGKYCGHQLPPNITSTTNKLLMVFRSDAAKSYTGFRATHTTVSGISSSPGLESTERNTGLESTERNAGLESTERSLTQHFLTTRRQHTRSINKWGTQTTKAAVALFLNDPGFFAPGNRTGEEIAYELSLQLLSKVALKKKIATKDMALFINALTVACIDPRDFFGTDLVYGLRNQISNTNYTNPFALLTLCNAKDTMTEEDVQKLQRLYDAHFRPAWTDTQAMVVMALSCIHSRSDINLDERILDEMVTELKEKLHKNATIDNLKTTALVTQALLAAGNYGADFDLSAAIKSIHQEVRRRYPSTHEIYYILPIFNSMSLANISSDHCATSIKTDLEVISYLSEYPDERIQVQVSVIVGDAKDFSRKWEVKVPANYSFYQVLENIGSLEPAYKVRYSVSEGKPYVIGLANFQDDTEDGSFWFIYTKPLSSTGSPKLVEQSPVDIQVKESEELILWYRSGFWENTK